MALDETPIRLKLKVLLNKNRDSYKNHHPFDFSDVENLALNIHNPAFVLASGSGTQLPANERNAIRVFFSSGKFSLFCVVIEKDGTVNDVVTLYPKDANRIAAFLTSISGIGKDVMAVDKKKTENLLRRWYNTTPPEVDLGFSFDNVLQKFGIVNWKIAEDEEPAWRF